ncbi:MAG TPA: LysM peptidoglycan-binding domain-containing protein [Actinomycetota bacterium]|jgi:LysM repeat protein
MRRPLRSAVRLAIVTFLAGVLIGVLVPRLFASDSRAPVATPQVHVVAAGETIWGLAQRFAPDEDSRRFVYEVLQLNDLRQPLLHPGQRLLLPAS